MKIPSVCRHITLLHHLYLTALSLTIWGTLPAYPLAPEAYAAESVLAQGKWVRIKVEREGMQLLTAAQLKSMGFPDPSKVNVYGYGGRKHSENLNATTVDDLPLLPSVRTQKGLVFFGTDHFKIERSTDDKAVFFHTINPYADASYYYLSDREATPVDMPRTDASQMRGGEFVTTFTEHLVHEVDLYGTSGTGVLLLGEDMRSTARRTFTFDITDPADDSDIKIYGAFGANVTGKRGVLEPSVGNKVLDTLEQTAEKNGIETQGTWSWIVTPITASSTYLRYLKLHAWAPASAVQGGKLNLNLAFRSSGSVQTARLDYLDVEYNRMLRLKDGQLHFRTIMRGTTNFTLAGCSPSTLLWDVTDPARPIQIDGSLNGEKLSFCVDGTGMREYIAFEPEKASQIPSAAGTVANQDLHGLDTPQMVIISPREFSEAANAVADMHRRIDGWTVHVIAPEMIYNEFSSGMPDVTAFRKMLKMWYDRAQGREGEYPRYCLIMGRPSYDNKGVSPAVASWPLSRVPIWGNIPGSFTESSCYLTDDYIGMLDDNGTALNIANAKLQVAVGRWPVKSAQEANLMARKLLRYVENPTLGAWRNNVLMVADDNDNAIHMQQSDAVYRGMRSSGHGKQFLYERLYLDSYQLSFTGAGAGYPEAKARMLKAIDNGVGYMTYIGHANPKSWTHEGVLNWNDINSFSNRNLFFLHAATCEFLRWDDDEISGGEIMWLYPESGVIGMVSPSRTVFISNNGNLNENTAPYVYRRNDDGTAPRVGDPFIAGKNATGSDSNKLRFCLMADPAMRMPDPDLTAEVLTVNGTDPYAAPDDMPVLQARSKALFTGRIVDGDGNLCSDFDGILEVTLMDAEKPIVTNGNGDKGKVYTYNDRKTRLFTGRVEVKAGEWTLTIPVPSEIENNTTTALLSMYASDTLGREANGACDRFHIFGFDLTAPDDTQGPQITDIYLNTPAFTDGTMVNTSPVLFATVADESGINLSEAGIGHRMSLTVDNKHYYEDVADYYTPDAADPTRGSLKYPVPGLEPGSHSLVLTAWDNANNSASAQLDFNVGIGLSPTLLQLSASASPAVDHTVFSLVTDRPMEMLECLWEVFDLNGNRIWHKQSSARTDIDSSLSADWDLTDDSGKRVARGLYVARVTVSTLEGYSAHSSIRIAVAAN